jgi:O-antigen ligase
MIGLSKAAIGYVVLGMVGGASVAMAAQLGVTAAVGVTLLPALVLILPAFITQGLQHLTNLVEEFDFLFVPWVMLFLSGLVFRIRDKLTIQEDPLDAWAMFRIIAVGVAFLLIFSLYVWGTCDVRSLYRGFPGILIGWALFATASTAWSVSPGWTLYKSLEYGVDVAVLATIISGLRTIGDAKRFFDWTWILLFGLLLSVWAGAVIWPDEALQRGVGLLGIQLVGVLPSVAANGVGELAALLAIVCLVRLIYSPHRICYGAVFACCCGTLIFSQTRSALVAFLGACLSILFATKRYVSGLLIVALAGLWLSSGSAADFWKFFRRGQDEQEFTNLSGRTVWWVVAIDKVRQRPVLGYGAYSGGRFVVSSEFGADVDLSSVHNDYLEILLGTGLVGLTLVATAITGAGYKVFGASHKPAQSRLEQGVTVEALAVFTLVIIRSMFSTPLFWHPPLPFLLIVGYCELVRRRHAQYSFVLPNIDSKDTL